MTTGVPRPRLPRIPRIPARRRSGSGRRGGWWRAGLLMLILVLVAGGAWLVENWREDIRDTVDAQRGIEGLRDDLEQALVARQAAEEARRHAEQQLEMKTAELAAFSGDIERQEAELLELREELAFYRRLAEGAGEDALGIRSLQLQRTGQSGVFDVVFQLYRPGLSRSVDLRWALEVEGYATGEEALSTLETDALGLENDRLVEGFRLLRNQRARIQLPEGFEPVGLTLRASAANDEDLEPVSEWADWDRLLESTQ